MSAIDIEVPTKGFDDNQREYIVRQLVKIDSALRTTNRFAPRYSMPAKYQIGDVYYFMAAIPSTDVTGEGLWVFKSTGWAQLG